MTAMLQQFRPAAPSKAEHAPVPRTSIGLYLDASYAGLEGTLIASRSAALYRSVKQTTRPEPPPVSLDWLGSLYGQVSRADAEGAVDTVFERLDDYLLDEDFAACDSALQAMDVGRLDTHAIVAVLSVTLGAAAELVARSNFTERARNRLRDLAPDRFERLLDGLE